MRSTLAEKTLEDLGQLLLRSLHTVIGKEVGESGNKLGLLALGCRLLVRCKVLLRRLVSLYGRY